MERLDVIEHKLLVLSGKGGVGKSTVAVNLAVALAAAGKKVGLLDIDIHGPSIPTLLGVEGMPVGGTDKALHPFAIGENLRVMSIGFLLRDSDDAVIWRGPMKYNVIKQFLGDVEWGPLDYLVVDSPPGTGDEPLTVAQLISDADGAIIVTTPQPLALSDVRKCITFCRQLSLPVLGVIENMSGFVCPNCGERTDIFKTGGGEEMAGDMGVPFLGRVPLDPAIVSAGDDGMPFVANFPETETGRIFASIAAPFLAIEKRHAGSESGRGDGVASGGGSKENSAGRTGGRQAPQRGSDGSSKDGTGARSRIAIPIAGGKLSMHFGHCERFAFLDVDMENKRILSTEYVDAPEHEPGLLPKWLNERGADTIIAGGMGNRARSLFEERGIEVIIGARSQEPEVLVESFLSETLETGENICDH